MSNNNLKFDFTPYEEVIKGYDGFIDQKGRFYKVKKIGRDSSQKLGHVQWAKAYLKNKLCENMDIDMLFELSKMSELKMDSVAILMHLYNFIYYSHDSELYKPLVYICTKSYYESNISREQIDKITQIMLANNENPFADNLIKEIADIYLEGKINKKKL